MMAEDLEDDDVDMPNGPTAYISEGRQRIVKIFIRGLDKNRVKRTFDAHLDEHLDT